jgi:uncharacterized membrane protein YsdA (DUF1294 family)
MKTTRRISTLAHTQAHTQTRHAQRAQQAGVHFPKVCFGEGLMVFNCQAGLYTIALKVNTLISMTLDKPKATKTLKRQTPKKHLFLLEHMGKRSDYYKEQVTEQRTNVKSFLCYYNRKTALLPLLLTVFPVAN